MTIRDVHKDEKAAPKTDSPGSNRKIEQHPLDPRVAKIAVEAWQNKVKKVQSGHR